MLVSVAAVVGLSLAATGDAPSRVALLDGSRFGGFLIAQAATDAIDTTDGKTHVGRIVDETSRGYLFQPESGAVFLIEFSQVKTVRRGAGGQSGPTPTAPSAAVNFASLDEIDEQIAALRLERAKYPTGGAVAMTVFGAVGFSGIGLLAGLFSYFAFGLYTTAGFAAGAVLTWTGTVVSLACLVLGILILARNGGPRRELTQRLEALEERRELILERRGELAPALGPNHLALRF